MPVTDRRARTRPQCDDGQLVANQATNDAVFPSPVSPQAGQGAGESLAPGTGSARAEPSSRPASFASPRACPAFAALAQRVARTQSSGRRSRVNSSWLTDSSRPASMSGGNRAMPCSRPRRGSPDSTSSRKQKAFERLVWAARRSKRASVSSSSRTDETMLPYMETMIARNQISDLFTGRSTEQVLPAVGISWHLGFRHGVPQSGRHQDGAAAGLEGQAANPPGPEHRQTLRALVKLEFHRPRVFLGAAGEGPRRPGSQQ